MSFILGSSILCSKYHCSFWYIILVCLICGNITFAMERFVISPGNYSNSISTKKLRKKEKIKHNKKSCPSAVYRSVCLIIVQRINTLGRNYVFLMEKSFRRVRITPKFYSNVQLKIYNNLSCIDVLSHLLADIFLLDKKCRECFR